MERLQSRLLIKPYFLGKSYYENYISDEKFLSYSAFNINFSQMLNNIGLTNNKLKKLLKNSPEYRYSANFYDLFTNQSTELPIRIINLITHSNGLCAGNSREEALVQGICEIFERYCYKTILLNEQKMSTIKIDNLNELEVNEQLSEIKSLGFSYEIKDCTLGGKFPVIGLIIYDENKEKYLFSIGADPNFNIALQRCITETFQGLSKDKIKNKMKNINNNYSKFKYKNSSQFTNENWLKCYTTNGGIHPSSFFENSNYINLKSLPFSDFSDNCSALEYLCNIIKSNNLKVYIKDFSYLGFPTYKVYIPTLSEIENLDETDLYFYSNLKDLTNLYYNLSTINEENRFKNIYKTLYKLSIDPKYNDLIIPSKAFNSDKYITTEYTSLNYFYLLLIILIINKEYQDCIQLINSYHKSNETPYEILYLSSLKYFLLNENFPYSLKDKGIKKDIKTLVQNSQKYLKKIKAPSCPKCNDCFCKKNCQYKNWEKINKIINLNIKLRNPK